METGVYEKVSPSRACLSSAMNVGHPSNLARFFDLYGGTVDRNGVVHRRPDVEAMRKRIYSVSITDRETKKTIKRIYDDYRVLLEPHGAVGWRGLEVYLELFGNTPLGIGLETAHPAKFPEEIRELTGINPDLPPALRDIDERSGQPTRLANNYDQFRAYLQENLRAGD